jgi:hypothetical protein
MSIDVSFWEPPNWKKEGAISSVFLGMVVAMALVLGAGVYYMILVQSVDHSKQVLQVNKRLDASLQKPYRDLKQLQEFNLFLTNSVIDPLIERQKMEVFVSGMLLEFKRILPDSIVLDKVSFDAFARASTKKGSPSHLQYRIFLKGYAIGNNSENIVGDFVKQLRSDTQFKEKLVSVAIQGRLNKVFSEELSTFKTVFSIDCIFEKRDAK